MTITDLSPEKYVPSWKGNRELPKAEQIVAEVRFPTMKEWEPFAGKIDDLDHIAIVTEFVPKITNLTIAGRKVKSGEELCNQRRYVVVDLVTELFTYFVFGMDLGGEREKNSERPSRST